MQKIINYISIIEEAIKANQQKEAPKKLYEPITYTLALGGKRIRPALLLLANNLFGGTDEDALDAALAIEVFHNFTLVHDDIMDDAPLRRGKPSIYNKWNTNVAILSGDVMLMQAIQLLAKKNHKSLHEVLELFNTTAIEVCEGQQMDMDFETSSTVSIDDYLKMIELKTAVLLAASLKIGAVLANASQEDAKHIYEFGKNLGIAFQLQDDYLDAFGDPETFGKQVGGDIIENKKTFLYLKAIENASEADKKKLIELFSEHDETDVETKITFAKEVFVSSGASEMTQKAINEYTQMAFKTLENLSVSEENKQVLIEFGESLMYRTV